MSVPSETAVAPLRLTKNCTLAIVPSLSAAVAVTELLEPTPTVAAFAGAVILTVGATLAATVTVTVELVVWLPAVSVATAVSAKLPVAAGEKVAA